MKKLMICGIAVAGVFTAAAQDQPVATKTDDTMAIASGSMFKNAMDSFSYAAGMSVAESMIQSGITDLNVSMVTRAMNDVFSKSQTAFTIAQANMTLQQKLQEFAQKKSEAQKAEGIAFLETNKKRTGVITLKNGLQYEVIKAGLPQGAKPKLVDTAVVNYKGTLMNGQEFDNSFSRGQAAEFPLTGVIRGWTEILQLMPKGAYWKVYIPSELAYGEHPPQGAPIPPNAVLIFEISLENIKPAKAPAAK